jgi:hypothetical protein
VPDDAHPAPPDARWGLCATCALHVVIASDRGSRFVQCLRARVDPRFARYPRLPMLDCPGFEAASGPAMPHPDSPG